MNHSLFLFKNKRIEAVFTRPDSAFEKCSLAQWQCKANKVVWLRLFVFFRCVIALSCTAATMRMLSVDFPCTWWSLHCCYYYCCCRWCRLPIAVAALNQLMQLSELTFWAHTRYFSWTHTHARTHSLSLAYIHIFFYLTNWALHSFMYIVCSNETSQ